MAPVRRFKFLHDRFQFGKEGLSLLRRELLMLIAQFGPTLDQFHEDVGGVALRCRWVCSDEGKFVSPAFEKGEEILLKES